MLVTTHVEAENNQVVKVEWPDWFEKNVQNAELMWDILSAAELHNNGTATAKLLALLNLVRTDVQTDSEYGRLLKYLLAYIGKDQNLRRCEQCVEVNGQFFRCALPTYHGVSFHLGRLGAPLHAWPDDGETEA